MFLDFSESYSCCLELPWVAGNPHLRITFYGTPDCNTNNIYITSDQDLIISYCKTDSDDPLEEKAGSINVSNILTGKCLAKICSSNCDAESWRGRKSSSRSTVSEALEDITARFLR